MVNDTFIGAKAGSWRREKILQPSTVTFLFPWILQSLCTTFPASGQVWVGGRALFFQPWVAHNDLGGIWSPWYAEVIDTSLADVTGTRISPKIWILWPFKVNCVFQYLQRQGRGVWILPLPLPEFSFFLKADVKRNQLPREEKRKQVDPCIATVQKHLFVLGTKMVASDFFPPRSGYINFCY